MSRFIAELRGKTPGHTIGSIILLAFTASCCTLPLFVYQSLLVSHDINFHVFQANEFYRSLAGGSFFPRWMLNSNNGYGSANFIFYSPLCYYIVAIFHLFIPSIIHSIIVAIWLSFFLSGVSMFFAAKRIAGLTAGLLCAVLYQIFPFHIFDLYLRGTLAELFAFIWYPLIFLFLRKMHESQDTYTISVGLSISYAGLILTHLVSGFIITIIMFAYLIFHVFLSANRKKVMSGIVSLVIGLGLSSYFLLPAVCEKKFAQIGYIFNQVFSDYQVGYIFNQVFSDYRKDFLFVLSNLYNAPGFKIPLHIAVILELFLFYAIFVGINKNNQDTSDKEDNKFFICLFIFSFYMTTPLSKWIWDISTGLKTIQFPWRWIPFMDLSLIFLMAEFIRRSNKQNLVTGNFKGRLAVYLLIMLSLLSFITILKKDERISAKDLREILKPDQFGYLSNLPKEYTPVWATDLKKLLMLAAPERVSVLSGDAMAKISVWQPERRVISVDVLTPAVLRIATFYYPGWTAESDGGRIKIGVEENSGVMLIKLPKSKHVLTLKFIDTPLRRAAKYTSLFSGLVLVVFVAADVIRRRRNRLKSGRIKEVAAKVLTFEP